MTTALTLSQQHLPTLPSTLLDGALAGPGGSIDAYISRVSKIPMLSFEEEQQLAQQWFYEENVDAAKQLVISNLRFVVQIARGYMGYGLALPDLIQEGNVGLMKAVKRFDPAVGVRLVSFAVHWIKSEIHDYVIRNWRIVRIATTKSQRKLFFKLRGSKKRLGWFTEDEMNQVAQELNVSVNDVREMEKRLQAHDDSFDSEVSDSEEDSYTLSPADYLTNAEGDPLVQLEQWEEEQQKEKSLAKIWQVLTPREQDIIQYRWLAEEKSTLHDLAARFNISAERVRQVEQNAMKKLQKLLPSSDSTLGNALSSDS